jgi:ribulose 1,5-bisphosphate carboxylase large subunit-like protein
MNWIVARIRFVAVNADGKSITPDEAQRVVSQVRSDALFGTFADLDDAYWEKRMERAATSLSEAVLLGEAENDPQSGLKRYLFEIKLNAELFPARYGGLQHLFGIIAGDLLQFTLPPITIKHIEIIELHFDDKWLADHVAAYRGDKANCISEVRERFNLENGMPFLAFSFKPRVGFRLDTFEEIATEVLRKGFNLVEVDTRFLARDADQFATLRNIAASVADKVKDHVARISLNMSLPPDLMLSEAARLCSEITPPIVLKIDGGLDGLSGLQALRRADFRDENKNPPIVTCYPLLRGTLARFVPRERFNDALAMSGADIMYPGGRPDLGTMIRSIEGQGQQGQVQAVERYRSIVRAGAPMPTIAGGIYAGQLQAFYELLGPDVAWFLGGGVALHKDGPAAGAETCVRIAKESAEKRIKAGRNWADDLGGKLPEDCQHMYSGTSALPADQLQYVSPKEHLAKVPYLKPLWDRDHG